MTSPPSWYDEKRDGRVPTTVIIAELKLRIDAELLICIADDRRSHARKPSKNGEKLPVQHTINSVQVRLAIYDIYLQRSRRFVF